jgi:hypothetical protein
VHASSDKMISNTVICDLLILNTNKEGFLGGNRPHLAARRQKRENTTTFLILFPSSERYRVAHRFSEYGKLPCGSNHGPLIVCRAQRFFYPIPSLAK